MSLSKLVVVILAAGRGTRFGEEYSKLLHPILGKPLIYYPILNFKNLGILNIIVVVSDPNVEIEIKKYISCHFVYQKKLAGTADALKLALNSIHFVNLQSKTVLVLNGDDATLYTKETLEKFLKSHFLQKSQISVMTLKTSRQMEVGRIIRDNKKKFSKILEYKQYLKSDIKSQEINCGVYLIDLDFAKSSLPKILKNSDGEYYLTDLLNIAKKEKKGINLFVLKNHSEWIGVNDKKDLKYAQSIIKRRNLIMSNDSKKLHVHFLGIGGSGTSACANLAKAAGFEVSGCDQDLSGEFSKTLKSIETIEGHNPNHLEQVDILAITPAILSLDPNNFEILEAKKRKIEVITWQQFLGKYLTEKKQVIAVCGTHGKSTTTAMIGKVLEDARLDPSVLLGANTPFWKSNFRIGKGKYFVIEADEFNDNYMSINPDITIVTNIEFDHPEYFKNFKDYKNSYKNFLHKTKHLIIANLKDKNLAAVLSQKQMPPFAQVFDFSKNLIGFELKIIGNQNIYNASAAFNLALNLGIEPEVIKKSLQDFPGLGRRMELITEINGAQIYSDFGHHPTEIKVTIEELKRYNPSKKIWLIYQPHMFSRTKSLFDDFVNVFRNIKASGTFIIDIYPSREVDPGDISSKMLVKAINKINVRYIKTLNEVFKKIKPCLTPEGIIVFMGAGDIDREIRLKIND